MIEKMTKYSFVLLKEQTEGFLEELQKLGVVDITRSVKPVDEKSVAMLEKNSRRKQAIHILESIDYCKDSDFAAIQEAEKNTVIEGCKTDNTIEAKAHLDELRGVLSAARMEIKALYAWGEFDKAAIDGLEEKGLKIRFYTAQAKAMKPEWYEKYAIEEIARDGSKVYFVTVAPTDAEYDFPLEECIVPTKSVKEALENEKAIEEDIIRSKGKLLHLKNHYLDHIKKVYARNSADLDRYLAASAKEESAEGYINIFVGYAPVEDNAALCKAFDKMDVYYIAEEAVEEDNPPIKLKNNRFARQFEVLTGMYGMPVYGEFDPTPILAPFFLLFFAMCMGDAGYGILLIIIGLVLKYKMADSGLGKMHRLVTFLGIGTLVVGCFLGTFFGMSILDATWAPSWMKAICIDGWFPDGKIAGFPAQMVLAVGIGVLHICLAMIVKSIGFTKRFGFKKTVSTWGWTILIVGGIILAALGTIEILGGEVLKWAVIVLAVVSGLAIYIFNTPGRNPLANIGSGLWDTYNMVTGLLGDVLSYIRLYALGLAGGMLGNAFNIMGTMTLDIPVPVLNWLLCIAVLIFGHLLNLAMSCLGAFVHPLRLTFVEYFKNSGYEGTGAVYNPLGNNKE